MTVVLDMYGNQLRAGYHVADLRGDSRLRGKIVATFIASLCVEVEWDNGETEVVPAEDLLITDTIHIRRRRLS